MLVVLISALRSQYEPAAQFFVYLVAALTVGSGIEYIVRANRMAVKSAPADGA